MANNSISILGIGDGNNTFFANSPAVITVRGLSFPSESPIKVCRVRVLYGNSNAVVGEFSADVGTSSEISFDISSALRALWNEYDFSGEIEQANLVVNGSAYSEHIRPAKSYKLMVLTEYFDSTDGEYTTTESGIIDGGWCITGGKTEWERYNASSHDISNDEHTNPRNGDASTKPRTSPELVGKYSITSWVDLLDTNPNQDIAEPVTKSIFYGFSQIPSGDDPLPNNPWHGHAPTVLRDTIPYTDFLFVNRRGAVETCSAQTKEAMNISVESQLYSRVGLPSYEPSRTIMSIATGGRRSWSMSSGYQTRDWAEWWALEFLMARRHWMLYKGKYVPVTVTPSKKATSIYDRTKQQMPSVEFTVTLALEG